MPKQDYISTVGNLYRGIEKGFADLVERDGQEGVFIGAEHTQASEECFGLPSLFAVTDLASARRAVEGIVEMGEGARGDWTNAHFGMFLSIFNEFMEMKKDNPDTTLTRPVVSAYTRPPVGAETETLISDAFTMRVADLFNASYVLAIQALSRFYVHEKDYQDELQALAETAVGVMSRIIKPLGELLTTLPVGEHLPGLTAGPSFELQHREYLLPHRKEAFIVMQERLVGLAAHADALSKQRAQSPVTDRLKAVEGSFLDLAKGLRVGSIGL